MDYPAIERRWAVCPHCGKRLVIYTNNAQCSGVYIRCKNCRKEAELSISGGKQNN